MYIQMEEREVGCSCWDCRGGRKEGDQRRFPSTNPSLFKAAKAGKRKNTPSQFRECAIDGLTLRRREGWKLLRYDGIFDCRVWSTACGRKGMLKDKSV